MTDTAQATFRSMDESTPRDWQAIGQHFGPFASGLADRVLTHLKLLDGDYGGFPIDRLQHSLQTATRAHRGGEDEPYVVMALLHDICDTLGSYNHPDIAAAMLKPFVDARLHWMCANHGIFQSYFFITSASTATCATPYAATNIMRTPRASANCTTSRPLTPGMTAPHSPYSSRWCDGCSPGRSTVSTWPSPNQA